MHASNVDVNAADSPPISPDARETAARLTALVRHVFRYDRGDQLRLIEQSGLSMTQTKVLLELGGFGQCPEAWGVSELAERFGVSTPSMSRAVDSLVRDELATRGEDPDDRRARQVRITAKGKEIVEKLVAVRLSGMAAFASSIVIPTTRT